MIEDSVVQEVRAVRDAFARSFGYDIRAMVAHLRALDASGDRPVIRLSPRPPIDTSVSRSRPDPARPRIVGYVPRIESEPMGESLAKADQSGPLFEAGPPRPIGGTIDEP